jgi:hypothetical protein
MGRAVRTDPGGLARWPGEKTLELDLGDSARHLTSLNAANSQKPTSPKEGRQTEAIAPLSTIVSNHRGSAGSACPVLRSWSRCP